MKNNEDRQLRMKYAGGLVKHLGVAMYRGPVPALAELIANAWDADAEHVWLSVPFGTGLKDEEIVVRDDGCGMSWEDVQDAYLVVGRDRRKAEGKSKTPGKQRRLMGRKGIGKLAGFGIAQVVEVRTVRDGWLTHFAMDLTEMTREKEGAEIVSEYEPDILADQETDAEDGTTITLKDLQVSRAIPEDGFRASMERRFSILNKGFEVIVNDEALAPYEPKLQFRFEGDASGWEEVAGVGAVQWWAGFTEKPIRTEVARGVAVLVRDKLAQAPFFFDLSGGVHGQAGLEYLTGEVHADQLDDQEDLIGTDRQGILWDEPMPAALLQWGQGKLKTLLAEWVQKRHMVNEEKLVQQVTKMGNSVQKRLGRLRPVERQEARKLIRALASIESVTDDPDRAKDLLDLLLRAFEDSGFFALLRALRHTSDAEQKEILRLITELDVFEIIKMAEVVKARVGVIQKFRQMIDDDVPEKPDMQDFLFRHPWLIDPEWQVVEHEKGLEKLIVEHFKLEPDAHPDSDRRVDFFCVSTRARYLIVEVKRPAKPIGKAEVIQIIDYLKYLRRQAPGTSGSPNRHEGVLVGHHVTEAGVEWRETAAREGIVVRSWNELLDVAERIHREFLETMKDRAPDDARIQSIGNEEEIEEDDK